MATTIGCTDCQKTYQAYLSDLPSEWRSQIADLMCKVKTDVSAVTCTDVKACETLTSLSPFTLNDSELSITYKDERGVSVTRTIDLGLNPENEFIINQIAAAQDADYWIDGKGKAANFEVTGTAIPVNGMYLPAANTVGFAANSTLITTIKNDGLMTHKGDIFLDAAISASPAISFFLNTLANSDYFIQRIGTNIELHGAGAAEISSNVDTSYTVNSNANRGFEWKTGGNNLAQLFTDGSLLLMTTAVQQTPDTSAMLELDSTTRGFLPSRMTTAQRTAIVSPSEGLIVYDLDIKKLCIYTTGWEVISSS